MNRESRFQGTFRFIYTHWPTYLFVYGGGFAVVACLLWVGSSRGRWGLLPLALALLLVLGYFFFASLWAAHLQYDQKENQAAFRLFELARLTPASTFVHIGLGQRDTAIRMSRRLLNGRLTVLDVYHPQLTPAASLARSRRHLDTVKADPRLIWLEGNLDLLPLPDRSTSVVTMNRTLNHFWQYGDRMRLLKELFRILEPGGRLVLIEPIRSPTTLLVQGPAALRLPSPSDWLELFDEAGFHLQQQQEVAGLAYYWCLQRPTPGQMRQLTFDFGFPK